MKKNITITIILIVVLASASVAYWRFINTKTRSSITLLSPNGGETVKEGSAFTIKWKTQNIPATDKMSITIRRVPPPALQTEGQEFDPLVFINLDNTGSKDWVVADMYPEGNYVLGITSYASLPVTNPITDESDATFKIIKSAASTPIAQADYLCKDNKTINAAFYKGEPVAVKPGEPPIPTGSVKIVLSDGRNFNLPQTISADGTRYANKDESFVFWSKGNGALVLENNVEKSYIGCVLTAKDTGGLPKAYADGTTGYSIRYPADYTLDASYKYQALGPGKDIYGVKFTIPSSLATGTNLSGFDTGVSVETIPSNKNCQAGLFLDGKVKAQTVTDNGQEYSVASTTDAGAGNRYEEEVWAVPGTNPCLAVRYLIHYSIIENYPVGAVKEFDRNSLTYQFDKIRQSLITQ